MLGLGIASFVEGGSVSKSIASFINSKSLDFDGTNDYVNTNYTANTLFRGSFSFSYWINLDAQNAIPIGVEKGVLSIFLNQHFNGGVNIIHYSNSDAALMQSPGSAYSTDTWHHIVVVVQKNSGSDTQYKLYIDNSSISLNPLGGFAVSEANHNAFDSSGEFLAIGAANDDGTPDNFTNGNIDEVAIFNKVLSGSEVSDIYNSGVPKDESSHDGLFMYYRFEDDVNDTTGTSNGTNNGATFSSTVPS